MEPTKTNTIIVIPSYNEARTIGSIVRDVSGMGFSALVIDDGSSDDTSREALNAGATVVRNKENIGKGGSIREGVRYVFEKMSYEWMIIMDGDGQHHPEDIPALIAAASEDDIDMVVGSRMTDTRAMPPVRYLTNRFMSWIISCMCGQSIPDSQCGFRLMRTRALKNVKMESDRYDAESEILFELAGQGSKIASAPVKTIYGDEISKIRPGRDTARFLGLVFRYLFKKQEP